MYRNFGKCFLLVWTPVNAVLLFLFIICNGGFFILVLSGMLVISCLGLWSLFTICSNAIKEVVDGFVLIKYAGMSKRIDVKDIESVYIDYEDFVIEIKDKERLLVHKTIFKNRHEAECFLNKINEACEKKNDPRANQ